MSYQAPSARLRGLVTPPQLHLTVPGDKSLSHRALILGALCHNDIRIKNLLRADDVDATRRALCAMGARIDDEDDGTTRVYGSLMADCATVNSQPTTLDCGNSGTSMRLLLGVAAALRREVRLIGDASLSKRPMGRVIAPLRAMGAIIEPDDSNAQCAPLTLRSHAGLIAREHTLKIASGQVKGALLIAALMAEGQTILEGALGGRDHTERMLKHFGATIFCEPNRIRISGPQALMGRDINICGDISSAAFWLCLGAIAPGAQVRIDHVMLNETRMGFTRLLQRMGADLRIEPARPFAAFEEPFGSLTLKHQALTATSIGADDVPALIDELPLVAVLATQTHGTTRVRGAGELRHKESDRITAICEGLGRMGASIHSTADGFDVVGPTPLRGAVVDSMGDHRIAMALSIAAMVAKGTTEVRDSACVNISYPQFFAHLPREAQG